MFPFYYIVHHLLQIVKHNPVDATNDQPEVSSILPIHFYLLSDDLLRKLVWTISIRISNGEPLQIKFASPQLHCYQNVFDTSNIVGVSLSLHQNTTCWRNTCRHRKQRPLLFHIVDIYSPRTYHTCFAQPWQLVRKRSTYIGQIGMLLIASSRLLMMLAFLSS